METDILQIQQQEDRSLGLLAQLSEDVLWRTNPAAFAAHLTRGAFKIPPHIKLLSESLVDAAEGRIEGLIVQMPPRHGKSELTSKYFPAWYTPLYRQPIILSSYEADFAAEWGAKARDVLLQHQGEVGCQFTSTQPASHRWELIGGGSMRTAGAGGAITGKGAKILILDDIHKNYAEAKSLTEREKIWNWWMSVAHSRLEPGGVPIIVMTRWDSDDIVGRILKQAAEDPRGRKYRILDFPMECEIAPGLTDALGRKRGDALWPERYDENAIAVIKGTVDESIWCALYQQRPANLAMAGDMYRSFNREVCVRRRMFDPHLPLFMACDFNVGHMIWEIGQYRQNPRTGSVDVWIMEELAQRDVDTPGQSEVLCKKVLPKYADMYRQFGHLRQRLMVFGDCNGRGRHANSSKSSYQTIKDTVGTLMPYFTMETKIKKSNPNVVDRVASVNALLKNVLGDCNLTMDSTCVELIEDFDKNRWDRNSDGGVVMEPDKSEKLRTHAAEAVGYMCDFVAPMTGLNRMSSGRGFLQ